MSAIARVAAASLLVLSAARPGASADPPSADAATRARQVLAAARQALGGDEALAAVKSISLEGQLRRRLPGEGDEAAEMSGSVRVDARPPDRYLRVDTVSPAPGLPGIPIATGLDGDEAWTAALPVAAGPNVVIRSAPPGDAGAEARFKDQVRRESAMFLVPLLTEAGGLEYAWVAEAESPDGKADVLQVTGGGLEARLFVDQRTHRPLMLTFKDTPPRMMMVRRGPMSDRHGVGPAASEAPPPPPVPAEATLFLSDWRKVGGLLLPHTWSKTLDGKPYEEIAVSRYLVNDPKLTTDKFRKKA